MESENNRHDGKIIKKEDKKKLCFKDCKDNTIRSLNEVEYFLHNWHKALKCFNFYKIFK